MDSQANVYLVSLILRYGRIPPSLVSGLSPNHFINHELGAIYEKLLAMQGEGYSISTKTVNAVYSVPIEDLEYILTQSSDEDGEDTMIDFARMTMKEYKMERIRQHICQLSSLLSEDVNEFIDGLKEIDKDTPTRGTKCKSIFEVLKSIEGSPNLLDPVPTYTDLDKYLAKGGLPTGVVTTVSGSTGGGKSSFVKTIAYNAAKHGKKVLYYTLEDSSESTILRMVAKECDIILSQKMMPYQLHRCNEIGEMLKDTQLYIQDKIPGSSGELCEDVLEKSRLEGVDLVIIDYITMLRSRKDNTGQEKVDSIMCDLAELSKELPGTAVVVVSQLSRQSNNAGLKGPRKEHLYWSASIEQMSKCIIILYDPKMQTYEQVRVAKICKQANGPSEVFVPMKWDERYTELSKLREEDFNIIKTKIENAPEDDGRKRKD